jgi:hypothetical protein
MAAAGAVNRLGTHRTSRPTSATTFAPRHDSGGIIPDDGDPAACGLVGGQPTAQSRSLGGDEAAPDTVLADVPVPQRERQAVAAHWAGHAESDGCGCLLGGPARFSVDREPLIGIESAISTPGVPVNQSPQFRIGGPPGHSSQAIWRAQHS